MKLIHTPQNQIHIAMEIINMAKKHLNEQGVDQWSYGYPNLESIQNDINNNNAYFVVEEDEILGYLCIDFGGEPVYKNIKGTWSSDENYVVVHRFALHDNARNKKMSATIFSLVEQLSLEKNVKYFRIDTDAKNMKMRHILTKNGFIMCGTIWFDNSEKIAFDKIL